MLAFLAKLLAALTSAGAPVLQWVLTHSAQILKAYEDFKAGKDLQTIINDLLSQAQAFAARPQAFACTPEDCCGRACAAIGQTLIDLHSGTDDAETKAQADLFVAMCALAAMEGCA